MKIVRTKENLVKAKAKHAAQVEIQKQEQAQAEIKTQPERPPETPPAVKTDSSGPTGEELQLQQAEHAQLKEAARIEALTPEQRCREDWDADPAIRAEFRKFEIYLAYKMAEAAGRVQRITGRVVTA